MRWNVQECSLRTAPFFNFENATRMNLYNQTGLSMHVWTAVHWEDAEQGCLRRSATGDILMFDKETGKFLEEVPGYPEK